MRYASPILVVLSYCLASFADGVSTGSWVVVSDNATVSNSGVWPYALHTDGLPDWQCDDAWIYAVAHEVTGTSSVFYAGRKQLYSTAAYAAGELQGDQYVWYPSGQKRFAGRYMQDNAVGIWKWFSDKGDIQERINWTELNTQAPEPPLDGYGGWDEEVNREYLRNLVRFGPPPFDLIRFSIITNLTAYGVWGDQKSDGLNWQRISVSLTTGEVVSVVVDSFIDIGGRHYDFTNRATFAEGVLRLDRPVRTSGVEPFRNAYLMENSRGWPRLFPESELYSLKWIIENEGKEAGLRFIESAGLPLVSRTETPQH